MRLIRMWHILMRDVVIRLNLHADGIVRPIAMVLSAWEVSPWACRHGQYDPISVSADSSRCTVSLCAAWSA